MGVYSYLHMLVSVFL